VKLDRNIRLDRSGARPDALVLTSGLTPSFRDGPKDQTRNLDVMKRRKTTSGFRVRCFASPRN